MINKNIKYLIENIVNFNPLDYGEDEIDIISTQDIDTLIIYPKNEEELRELVAKRLAKNPEKPYLLDIDTSQITNMGGLFSDNTKDQGFRSFNRYFDIYGVCSADIKELNLKTWDTSNVTNMDNMFYGCKSLEKINLSSFDTANVTNMDNMFYGCKEIVELDLSNFNTSKVTNMEYMFCRCESLSDLNIYNFNTSNVKTMQGMFSLCKSLKELDLSHFNTDNVKRMVWMFNSCVKLEKLNLTGFNTDSVQNMDEMFYNCSSLTKGGLITDNKKLKR